MTGDDLEQAANSQRYAERRLPKGSIVIEHKINRSWFHSLLRHVCILLAVLLCVIAAASLLAAVSAALGRASKSPQSHHLLKANT